MNAGKFGITDVENCPTVTVEGQHYLIFYDIYPQDEYHQVYDVEEDEEIEHYEDVAELIENDEDVQDMYICGQEGDIHRGSCYVPKSLVGLVIGKGKCKQNRIEMTTNCVLSFNEYKYSSKIDLISSTKQGVLWAGYKIKKLLENIRENIAYTHFVSLPIVSDSVARKYQQFMRNVSSLCGDSIDKNLFQLPRRLHLTITMLTIIDPEDKKRAIKIMDRIAEEVIIPTLNYRPIRVRMRGLDYMNDDPTEVNVLYANVIELNSKNTLQTIANEICRYFSKTGLMREEDQEREQVKLHVTLMNTRFAKDEANDRSKQLEKFNALPILKEFKDYDFGEVTLNSLHLSQRFSINQSGYYKSAYQIDFS